jgi:hypothetical protein
VGDQNHDFFATFDVQPMSAQCECDGGEVQAASNTTGDAEFEQMVQTITDQIMASRA